MRGEGGYGSQIPRSLTCPAEGSADSGTAPPGVCAPPYTTQVQGTKRELGARLRVW